MTPDNRESQPSPNNQRPANQSNSYPQVPGANYRPSPPPYGQVPRTTQQPGQPYGQNQRPAQYGPPPVYQPTPSGKPPKQPKNRLLLWGGIVGGLFVAVAVTVLVLIPLFNRSTRSEADPFAASNIGLAATATAPNPTSSGVVTTPVVVSTISTTTGANNSVVTKPASSSTAVSTNPTVPAAPTVAPTVAALTTTPAVTTAPAKTTTAAQIFGKGEFTKIDAIHYARGTATVGIGADGKKVLRFDNFTSNQGPDLKVYLGTRQDGSKVKEGGLNLGALPATDGSYNINLPDNADLAKYKSVVIWCEAFSVTFSYASLV